MVIIKLKYKSEFPGCMVLDYLPFNCKNCNKYLCKEHYHNDNACPFSQLDKNINNNDYESNVKNSHLKDINTICSFCKIIINNNKGYECSFCKKPYCLKHRLEIDHRCPESSKRSISDSLAKNKNMIMDKIKNLKKK